MVKKESIEHKDFKEMMQIKNTLQDKLKNYETKIDLLNKEKLSVWKEMSVVNQYFKKHCNHNWGREAYHYSPLRCSICEIERA